MCLASPTPIYSKFCRTMLFQPRMFSFENIATKPLDHFKTVLQIFWVEEKNVENPLHSISFSELALLEEDLFCFQETPGQL